MSSEESKNNVLEFLTEEHLALIKSEEFEDKISIFWGNWSVKDCQSNQDSLYVFGDNDIQKGCGGQAVVRLCKNSIGIPTKKEPNNHHTSFYTDDDYDRSCKKIQSAIIRVIEKSKSYKELVFPQNGFGTGLANLPTKAPKTYKYLNSVILECFGIDYDDIAKNGLQLSLDPEFAKTLESLKLGSLDKNIPKSTKALVE